MVKRHMEADTLLYVGRDFALAFNREFLKRNYHYYRDRIKDATKVYYKSGNEFASWINYKSAIQNNSGSYDERIEKALKNPLMSLSKNLLEIPSCYYIDNSGSEYFIKPNDGITLKKFYHERTDYLYEQPEYSPVIKTHLENNYEIDLKVKFKQSIKNAIITLNSLFIDYDVLNDYEIIYRNIKNYLYKCQPTDKMTDKNFEFEVNVHKWKGMCIDFKLRPIGREDNVLLFSKDISPNGLLVYNSVLLNYTVDKDNPKKVYINLDDFNFFQYGEPVLTDFVVTTFKCENYDDMVIRKVVHRGVNNILPGEVEFPCAIKDSLIVFNGLNYPYYLNDEFTVVAPVSNESLGLTLENDTPVYAISFYSGMPENESAGRPENETDAEEDDNHNYVKRVSKPMFNDYNDYLDIGTDGLMYSRYIPLDGTIRLLINGVQYEENLHFIFKKSDRSIRWIFNSVNNGFDLTNDFTIVAVYDLYFEDNNIPDVGKFILEYKDNLLRRHNII